MRDKNLKKSDALPPPAELAPALQEEPMQVPVRTAPFTTTVQGITYTVNPLFAYELAGLVVSKHDAKTWWDYLHREWNDHLNVVDLCVVWGNNARNGACETFFIDSVEIIKRGGKHWRVLVWVSSLLLALGVFAWFARPVRLHE